MTSRVRRQPNRPVRSVAYGYGFRVLLWLRRWRRQPVATNLFRNTTLIYPFGMFSTALCSQAPTLLSDGVCATSLRPSRTERYRWSRRREAFAWEAAGDELLPWSNIRCRS